MKTNDSRTRQQKQMLWCMASLSSPLLTDRPTGHGVDGMAVASKVASPWARLGENYSAVLSQECLIFKNLNFATIRCFL